MFINVVLGLLLIPLGVALYKVYKWELSTVNGDVTLLLEDDLLEHADVESKEIL